jgi:hypothetical protein
MSSYLPLPLGSRFTTTLQTFAQQDGLPFATVLSEDTIQQLAIDEDMTFATDPDDVYTPALTLWAFLTQAMSSGKSCVEAVSRVIALRFALDLSACAANTGAYCKARAKLSERFLARLTYQVGDAVEDTAPTHWRWQGRRVLLVDGCELTMPDTPLNQTAYPQPNSQEPGLGFPLLRLVVLLTYATACLVGAAFGPHQGKETGETALFRQLLDRLRPGDIVVADRYYCSYWLIALLTRRGVDVVFRLHQRRHYDFRRGRQLGPRDHIVTWNKPQRPLWLDEATYQALPDTLELRELYVQVDQPGYRTKELVIATTLVATEQYSRTNLADLYQQRWHVELDIRSIKQTLRIDMLSCKTPAMIRRELWVHLLGYNLLRKVMAQAAWEQGRSPRQLSFAGALQTLEAFRWLLQFHEPDQGQEIIPIVLGAIGAHEVGNRPGRCEPRCVKRRPKPYARLTKPRAAARAELLRN